MENKEITPGDFLENTEMTDDQFNLKLDWEHSGKATNHPFIHFLMEEYANHKVKEVIGSIGDDEISERFSAETITGAFWVLRKLNEKTKTYQHGT